MARTLENWRDILLPKLAERITENAVLRDYYNGDHPLPTAPNIVDDKYRRLAAMAVTNMCGLIVDAPTSKLTPKGVRLSEDAAEDTELWGQVWKSNRLNAQCRVAHEEALKVGRSFVLVWPSPDNKAVSVTIEDADQVIVAYAPGNRYQRLAALKWYACEGFEYVTVWDADNVFSWYRESNADRPSKADDWEPDPEMTGGPHPFKRVPVVELLSKPDAKGCPTPELSTGVLRMQNRINKTMFDIVVGGEDGAFPQRVFIGVELPDEGLRQGPNRIWSLDSQDNSNPSAGQITQIEAYDTSNLLTFAETSIREIGWISRTSAIFMLGGSSNIGADLIRALDDGFASKIIAHQMVLGEGWEEVFALALIAQGKTPPMDIEIDWEAPGFSSPAEMADAAIKLRTAGYAFEDIARYMGASPAEVKRLVANRQTELDAANAPAA